MAKFFYLMAAALAWGQGVSEDRAFNRIPFEEWLKGGAEGRVRWSVRVIPPVLTVHQRLSASVSIQVDGSEFANRKPGQLVVFLELRDSQGRTYRAHRALNMDELKKPSELAIIGVDFNMFVTPGDYRAATAIYDQESKEHVVKIMKLHVADLARDPVSGMWKDLPPVEFVDLKDPPERWFLPEITSKLSLVVKPARPVRVEIVVNESPTETALRRTGRMSRRNMGSLVPALKVLSQMEIQGGSLNTALLDLERRKISFEQEGRLDWNRLKDALLENDPNTIDVHALENHEQNAQFFVTEVRKRLEGTEQNGDVPLGLSAEPARVVIVLSGPMAFPKTADLRPIEAVTGKVFYIRYYPPVGGPSPAFLTRGGRNPGPRPPIAAGNGPSFQDTLAATLKPVNPRKFDVTTPMEFRMALAAIMSEISRLK